VSGRPGGTIGTAGLALMGMTCTEHCVAIKLHTLCAVANNEC
jgi:hypothetical protein